MTIQEIDEAIDLYRKGESLAQIGRLLGHDSATIKRNLVKHNITIRTRKEQNILSNQARRKKVKDDYFSKIDAPTKAWLLGFIASDGIIRREVNVIKIGLSLRDKEILEKIKDELGIEKKIFTYQTSNGFDVCELSWTSKQQKEDLAKFGIVNRKTYKALHLPNLPDNLKLAYILGYFDGDGSISISKEHYLRFRLCAYRPELLQEIGEFLKNKYHLTYSFSKDPSRNMYELSISTFYANKLFADMYSLNSLHLERKYKKYLEYLGHETTTS